MVAENTEMEIVIGPVLRYADGYRFDTLSAEEGVIRGYAYHRVEDAYYARNAEIRASARGCRPAATVCQTLDEFAAVCAGTEMLAAA